MAIEWSKDGETSKDGKWVIRTEHRPGDPPWTWFLVSPDEVHQYCLDNPGDTDAWRGRYATTLAEMHAQAERLLEIVANPTKKRRAKR